MEVSDKKFHPSQPKGAKRTRGSEDRPKDPKRVKQAYSYNKNQETNYGKRRKLRPIRVTKHVSSTSAHDNLSSWLVESSPPRQRRGPIEPYPEEEEDNYPSLSDASSSSEESDEYGYNSETPLEENDGNHHYGDIPETPLEENEGKRFYDIPETFSRGIKRRHQNAPIIMRKHTNNTQQQIEYMSFLLTKLQC